MEARNNECAIDRLSVLLLGTHQIWQALVSWARGRLGKLDKEYHGCSCLCGHGVLAQNAFQNLLCILNLADSLAGLCGYAWRRGKKSLTFLPWPFSCTSQLPPFGPLRADLGVAITHPTPLFLGGSVKPQVIHPVCETRNTCCQEPLWVRRELSSRFSVSLGRVNNNRKASADNQEVAESPGLAPVTQEFTSDCWKVSQAKATSHDGPSPQLSLQGN